MNSVFGTVFNKVGSSVGYNAMLLSITRNLEDENKMKAIMREAGVKFVVTEIGGKSNEVLHEKISKAVIGASLNEGLIEKTAKDLHAVLHATEEAKKGILINTTSLTNVVLKIAIVRDESWIAVGMFGESSIHPTTSHERCGLGIMHI